MKSNDRGDRRRQAMVILSMGSVMISFSSIFVKLAQVGPIASGFYRVFFGALFLLPFALATGKRPSFKPLLPATICGLIFAIDLTVWHKSIHGVGPGLATVLGNLQVFVLTLFGILVFKEKSNKWTWISVGLAITGLLLLVGPGWHRVTPEWKWGLLFGLMTALVYSTYILSLRRLQSDQGEESQIWNMLMVSATCAGFMALEIAFTPEVFAIPDNKSLWALVALGFLGQGLGWYLISRSLPLLDVSVSGLIILIQPALSFAWDILFFSRPTTLLDIAGASLVLTAIYLGTRAKKL